MPLTALQLRYLKTILRDKRIRLFDLDFDYFDRELADVKPLWQEGDYEVFDAYADGDDFEDEGYKTRFRMILEAKQQHRALRFSLKNRNGEPFTVSGIPEKIEYSEKDDKFRVILFGKTKTHTVNLGRIVSLSCGEVPREKTSAEISETDTDTVVLEVTDERNALERVSLHFANLKKKTTKLADNTYRMELSFNREDASEMVIRLLQFGPVIKVLEPPYIVREIVKRINMQLRLL